MGKNQISRKELKDIGLRERDLRGGISSDEMLEIQKYFWYLTEKYETEALTDKEKVIMEIIYNIIKNPERGYDYEVHFHRRLGFIQNNKNKIIVD